MKHTYALSSSKLFSVLDVFSDYILTERYLNLFHGKVHRTVQTFDEPSVILINSSNLGFNLGEPSTRECDLFKNGTVDLVFACYEQHFWFGFMTLFFVYLPSINVISSLYGPKTAVISSVFWGLFGLIVVSLTGSELGIFLLTQPLLGIGMMISTIRCCGKDSVKLTFCMRMKILIPRILLYPILIPVTPFISILIKFLCVFKPENTIIKNQHRTCSRAESMLESTPQLMLQMYIVLVTLAPTNLQLFAILTSSISICVPNIEKYLVSKKMEFDLKSILKNVHIFSTASFFRALTFSVTVVVFSWYAPILYFLFWLSLFFWLLVAMIISRRNPYRRLKDIAECMFLSWFTLTNLQNTKTAAICRLVSSIYQTVYFTFPLLFAKDFISFNLSPEEDDGVWDDIINYWKNLPILEISNSWKLNFITKFTVILGWMSLIFDLLTALLKSVDWKSLSLGPLNCFVQCFVDPMDENTVFLDRSIFQKGWKYICHCYKKDEHDDSDEKKAYLEEHLKSRDQIQNPTDLSNDSNIMLTQRRNNIV